MPSLHRTVRPARRDDLEQLVELSRRAWLSAFAQTAPFAVIAWWAETDRARTLCQAHWPQMLVLEEDGRVSGLVQTIEDEINGLWVRPERQGCGVGTRLLRASEETIRAAGHARAWLTCSAWNVRALAYYAARGYQETGRTRYLHAAGVEVEDVRLERVLATLDHERLVPDAGDHD